MDFGAIPEKHNEQVRFFWWFFQGSDIDRMRGRTSGVYSSDLNANGGSHPHEIKPGSSALFRFWLSEQAGYVDVKSTLNGEDVTVALEFKGVLPKGWGRQFARVWLEFEGLPFDNEGVLHGAGGTDIRYISVNLSATDLLWHQCSNN